MQILTLNVKIVYEMNQLNRFKMMAILNNSRLYVRSNLRLSNNFGKLNIDLGFVNNSCVQTNIAEIRFKYVKGLSVCRFSLPA